MMRPQEIIGKKFKTLVVGMTIPFLLSSCLNSAVNTEDGSGTNTRGGDNIAMISPWKAKLSWNVVNGALAYNIYEAETSNAVVSSTKFLYGTFDVAPNKEYNFRVYPELSSGKEDRRPFDISFSSWKEFKNIGYSATNEDLKPVAINYTYTPWSDVPGLDWAIDGMKTECAFLKNGSINQDPFANPSQMVIGSTRDQSVVDKSCSLQPGTTYLVGCRVRYADNNVSASDSRLLISTPANCSAESSAPSLSGGSIQLTPFVGFRVENAVGGSLSIGISKVDIDNNDAVTETPIWSFSDIFGADAPTFFDIAVLSELDVAYADLTKKFNGLASIKGIFSTAAENGNQNTSLVPLDFYAKDFNDAKATFFPPIVSLEAGQEMGKSIVSGDFNCDGSDDLAIGFPSATWLDTLEDPDNPVKRKTGVVVVIYGHPTIGLNYATTAPSLTPVSPPNASDPKPPAILYPLRSSEGASTFSSSKGPQFGHSLAVGNFNRDANATTGSPCQDLLIGAPYEKYTAGEVSNAGGAVYIAYGGKSGLRSSWVTPQANGQYSGSCTPSAYPSQGNVLPRTSDYVNAGSTGSYPTSQIYAEAAGCSGLHLYSFATRDSDSSFYTRQTANIFISTESNSNESSGARFGWSVAAGDLNRDGFDDIAIGAPSAELAVQSTDPNRDHDFTYNGAAFVYFGGQFGIRTNRISTHTLQLQLVLPKTTLAP